MNMYAFIIIIIIKRRSGIKLLRAGLCHISSHRLPSYVSSC